jgi:CarboxypepD_reg-like domain
MIRTLIFLSIHFVISLPGISQILITGKVLGATDKLPISYTNIGILNSEVGTISELDGSFSITIPSRYTKSKLLFASLGYTRVNLSIDSIKNASNITVYLEEAPTLLKPVTVKGNKSFRHYKLGNEISEGGSIYADTTTAGSAMAVLIDNNGTYSKFNYPANVEKASLKIELNTFKWFKIRIRLYDIDSLTGMPGKDFLHKSIVQNSKIKDGWLSFNLESHNIVVNGPFYLAFEWILEKSDRRYLRQQYIDWQKQHPRLVTSDYSVVDGKTIPYANYNSYFWAGTSFGVAVNRYILEEYKCFFRFSSFSTWMRSPSILTATVVLSN